MTKDAISMAKQNKQASQLQSDSHVLKQAYDRQINGLNSTLKKMSKEKTMPMGASMYNTKMIQSLNERRTGHNKERS